MYLEFDVEVVNVLKWCFEQLVCNDDIGSICCCVISLVLRNALIVFKFVMLWNVYFLSLCLWFCIVLMEKSMWFYERILQTVLVYLWVK